MNTEAESDARTLQCDLQRLRDRAASATRDAEQKIGSVVQGEPYLAIAAALGVGFLLGGGIKRSTATLLLGAGARMLAFRLGDDLLERLGAFEDGDDDPE